jgi:hypothetical protein
VTVSQKEFSSFAGRTQVESRRPGDRLAALPDRPYDLVVSKLPQARRRALGWRGDA